MRPPDVSIEKQTLAGEIGVAQAIYDNIAEWPDELAFERGEILRVLDERPGANGDHSRSGWWYCVNKDGQRGIVPSNRLRMMHRFDNNNQRVITPHRLGDLFMFNDAMSFPFGAFDDSFMHSSSFMSDSMPHFSFDSGTAFDRIFPLSPIERFNNLSLRCMSNGDVGATPGVVRNIPIKIEEASTGPSKLRNENEAKTPCQVPIVQCQRHSSAPPPSNATVRRLSNGGHVSPPPPPQRKYFNTINNGNPSPSSSASASGSDEEQRRPRTQTMTPVSKTFTPPLSRPSVTPKPNIGEQFRRRQLVKEFPDTDYDKPRRAADDAAQVAWRLTKLASPLGTTDASSMASVTRGDIKPKGVDNISSNESDACCVHVNTILNDDIGSSSPSSSGIVADINDCNTDSNQRTSAASSLSAGSSSEQGSDHSEPAYDTPRPSATHSREPEMKNSNELRAKIQPSAISRTLLSPQDVHLNQLKRPSDLCRSPSGVKSEQNSTSVLQNVLNGLNINKNKEFIGDEPRLAQSLTLDSRTLPSKKFDRSPSIPQESMLDSLRVNSPEERLNRGASFAPEMVARYRASESSSPVMDEAATRKRTICAKLSENFRTIELGVKKIDECTAPKAWRQPHVLQQHLLDIKEAVEMISTAVNNFLDAVSRIAVDMNSPKADDLKQLLTPLRNSHSLVVQLKQNIENTGWTLSALSRPRSIHGSSLGNDALDQFVAVVKQLPADCYKVLQWALSLAPSSAVKFLAPAAKESFLMTSEVSNLFHPQNAELLRLSGIEDNGDDSKRHSATSTVSTATATSSSDFQAPPSILANRVSLGTPAAGQDSGEARYSNGRLHAGEKSSRVTFADTAGSSRPTTASSESRVMEEDDLESVISDRDSMYQDYAFASDEARAAVRRRPMTSVPPISQLNAEVIASLSEDDRQLLRFYSPQLDTQTEFLSRAIDDFLNVVEEQFPPREFVQKGKLIILAAHKLIYIGDNIAQCVTASSLAAEVRRAADRLCCVLKNCVQATKHAADKYPLVSAVQSMVDSIVTVSHAAHDLKLLVKQCC